MKVCFPTQTNEGLAAAVYGHFGSAPFFTLCDTQDGAAAAPEIIDNAQQHHAHGMCQPVQALGGRKIDAVVCGGMGARAVTRLNEAGIRVFRADGGTVGQALEKLAAGALEEIDAQGACGGHHGCH